MEKLIIAIIGILLMPFQLALWGFTISRLWGWFVVPTFDVRPLRISIAIGLYCLLMLVFHRADVYPKRFKDDTEEAIYRCVDAFLHPAMILAIGWVVYQFSK